MNHSKRDRRPRNHPLLGAVCAVLLLAGLALEPSLSAAQPPKPPPRFRWVDRLDDVQVREHGPYLSRPLASSQATEIPLPDPGFAVDFQHYPTSSEIGTFLCQLQDTYPDLVDVTVVARSWQGHPIYLVRIGNAPSGVEDTNPALYVDGQHHAREAVSSQVVLYFLWYLASGYATDPLVTHLLDTRVVYAIPCVNPDGNDIFLTSDHRQRRTANPTSSDDDRDGQYDEDGREGAGYGTYEIYHYAFDSAWADAHPDDPFAEGWQPHYLGRRFVGLYDGEGKEVPQIDNDGDGRLSEDPPGGVDANRNYASHWELGDNDPCSQVYHGPEAFSEPETRAVRDVVLTRPNIATALSFHSGSDLLLHPWSWSTTGELPDRYWYEILSRKGSQLSERNGFAGAPHAWTARAIYLSPGSTIDWLYEQGILTWTPETYAASELAFTQRITTGNTYSVALSTGHGFNPVPSDIPRVVDRWLPWSLYLLAATPNVGLGGVAVLSNTLAFTVTQDGLLAVDVEIAAQTEQGVYATTLEDMSAGLRRWTIPWQVLPEPQAATLTITATTKVGTSRRSRQVEVVRLEIDGQNVRVVKGRLEPFVNLAPFFGGWFAAPQWDSSNYHLGEPLLVDGDMNGDCQVDIVDIMLVASRWRSRLGDVLYDARYDLDADNDIDIVDIMRVASRWGENCL